MYLQKYIYSIIPLQRSVTYRLLVQRTINNTIYFVHWTLSFLSAILYVFRRTMAPALPGRSAVHYILRLLFFGLFRFPFCFCFIKTRLQFTYARKLRYVF